MTQANPGIRVAAKCAGIPFWRIAYELGVSEATFIRWLRFPLSAEREEIIKQTICFLSEEVR